MNGPMSFISIFLLALLVTILIRGDLVELFPSLTNFFRDIFYVFHAFYNLMDGTQQPVHHSPVNIWFPYPLIIVLIIIIFIILLWDK